MSKPVLEGLNREKLGKGFSNKSRAAGYVPAVVYGEGQNKHINLEQSHALEVLHRYGDNALVELRLGPSVTTALVKEVQREPISGKLLHIDFKSVDTNTTVHTRVPINFTGMDNMKRQGGVVETQRSEIEIECLPDDVPKAINVDLSSYSVGDTIKVKDIEVAAEISIIAKPEDIVASLTHGGGHEVPDVEHGIETKS